MKKPIDTKKNVKGNDSKNEVKGKKSSFSELDSSKLSIIPSNPMLCPTCYNSIEIELIEMEDEVYKISFTCQNGHKFLKKELIEYSKEKPKQTKEITSCENHDEKFLAYCTECGENLCLECALEDEHHDQKDVIIPFASMFPGKKEMNEFVKDKQKEIKSLEEAKDNLFNWMDELKEKIEILFKNQETLIQFQKSYVENLILNNVNYSKGKSLNYLMKSLRYQKDVTNLLGTNFENSFSQLEKEIIHIIGFTQPLPKEEKTEIPYEEQKEIPVEQEVTVESGDKQILIQYEEQKTVEPSEKQEEEQPEEKQELAEEHEDNQEEEVEDVPEGQ